MLLKLTDNKNITKIKNWPTTVLSEKDAVFFGLLCHITGVINLVSCMLLSFWRQTNERKDKLNDITIA